MGSLPFINMYKLILQLGPHCENVYTDMQNPPVAPAKFSTSKPPGHDDVTFGFRFLINYTHMIVIGTVKY